MKTSPLRIFLPISFLALILLLPINLYAQWWQDWEKDTAHNPMIAHSSHSWFDQAFSQSVIYEDSMYKMWFTGWHFSSAQIRHIGYAESYNGYEWDIYPEPVIYTDTLEWNQSKLFGTVLRVDDTLRMWYAGSTQPCGTHYASVGYAWSINGINWTVYEEPIVTYTEWNETRINDPMVYYDGEMYHMYYDDLYAISYATSVNGIDWEKDWVHSPVMQAGAPFTYYDEGTSAGGILVKEDTMHMWFWAHAVYQDYSIGHAMSSDYINWTIDDEPALVGGPIGSWDDDGAVFAAVMINEGRFRMWYSAAHGVSGTLICAIGYANGDTVFSCFAQGAHFSSQADIDAFPTDYFYCHEINGDVTISGSDITNLNGLDQVTAIHGDLIIYGTANLIDLSGLENLETIGGDVYIGKETAFGPVGNAQLINLNGFNSSTINGDLFIAYNPSLSDCHVSTVCDYIAVPNGIITIQDNAPGCNNIPEVQDSCDAISGVNELAADINLSIQPNPSSGTTYLRYSISDTHVIPSGAEGRYVICEVFSLQGIKVKTLLDQVQKPGVHELEFDISDLPAGMYFVRLQTGRHVETVKIIKVSSRQ